MLYAEVRTELPKPASAKYQMPLKSLDELIHGQFPRVARVALLLLGVLGGMGLGLQGRAQEPTTPDQQKGKNAETEAAPVNMDKSHFNLFNPTPDADVRPFSTDRPGTTLPT